MKKLMGLLLMLSLVLVVVGCNPTPKTSELLEQAKEALEIVYSNGDSADSVTKRITLISSGKNGSTITWSSNNTNIIANDGSVTRPEYGSGDVDVTLTATIMINDEELTKTFDLTVKEKLQSDAQKLAEAKQSLEITFANGQTAANVTSNITLPTTEGEATVTWASSLPSVISTTGTVTRPNYDQDDAIVILVATITVGAETDTKSFTLTVPANEMTDADAVSETKSKIIILNGLTTAEATFSLPTTSANGATITWVSDNAAIEITNNGATAKVTRPEYGQTDAVVTLTATITLNAASDTRTFVLDVPALTTPPAKIVDFKLTAAANDEFTLTATVIGLHVVDTYKGYYIYDGTETIYVHNGSTVPTVAIGDEIKITGKYAIYYGMPQLIDPNIEVLSSGNSLPTPYVKALADFDTENSGTRFEYHSDYVRVESALITKVDGKYYMTQNGVTHQIFDQTSSALEAFVNKTVNINLIAHSYHSMYKVWQFSFTNQTGDIEEVTLTDQQIIDQAKAMVELPTETFQNLELPTSIGGVTVSWASSDETIIALDGTVVLPAEITNVTLIATFTLNGVVDTKTFTITVLNQVAYVTAADANAAANGTELTVAGIVYANSSYGYLIYSGGEFAFVYTNKAGDAIVGDEVILNVTIGSYKNLKQLQSPTLVDTISTKNALPVIPTGTLAELTSRTKTAATVTATISIETSYNNVYLTDADGTKVQVYYKSTVEYGTTSGAILKQYAGQTVTLPVIMYQDGLVLFVGDDATIDNGLNKTVANTFFSKDGSKDRVEGIVIANSSYGYVIYSGGEYGFVYTNAPGTAVVGDNVVLDITMGTYKGLRQLSSPVFVETLSSNNPLPVMPEGTIAQLTSREMTAAYITGTITVETSYANVYITDANGDKVQVYYKSTPDYNTTKGAVLKAYEGQIVTLPVVMYQDGLVLFLGTDSDVTPLTGVDLITYVKDQVVIDETVTDNITLPTTIGGVTITWASTDETVIATDGTVVRPAIGQADATITLTATFTIEGSTDTDTKTFTITVPALVEQTTGITNLFFSEYIEGGSNNKVLEIYNGTGADVDLSQYTVELYSNGGTSAGNTLTLTGTLANGDVYIIYNAGSVDAIKTIGDVDSTVTYFNGDDAIVLKHNSTIIDSIGQVGFDPGSAWDVNSVSTANMTLVRKATVTSGDTNTSDVFDPSVEWVAYPQDTFSYLGSHTTE